MIAPPTRSFAWRASGRALLLCAALAAAGGGREAPAAGAAPPPTPPAEQSAPAPASNAGAKQDIDYSALTESERIHILMRLIAIGEQERAAFLLQRFPFEGRYARNRTLFFEGMIARARGDLDGAVKKFRTALADDPDLTLVRVELAQTLYAQGEDAGARHHLELLSAAAPTPELAKRFEQFIDVIDERRPWQFNAWLAMAPSTNFTNGTKQEVIWIGGLPFVINPNSREQSGIGVKGGVFGSWVFRPADDISIVTAAGANFREYKGDDFDDLVVSQTVEVRKHHALGEYGLGVVAQQRWLGGDEFVWGIGPQFTIRQQFGPRTAIQSKLRVMWNDWKEAEYREGVSAVLDNRVSFAVSSSQIFYLLFGVNREITEQEHLSYWGGWGGAALYQELSYGLNLYTELRVGRQLNDANYPLLGEPRSDWLIAIDSTLTKRDFQIFGLAPQIEFTYARNFSNTPFDEYEAYGANFTLTKAF